MKYMHETFNEYVKDIRFTGDIKSDVFTLLNYYNYEAIYHHCCDVAEEAVKLAEVYGEDKSMAYKAGLLHDIGAIIPKDKRVEMAPHFEIEVLEEEKGFPMILHQKYSSVIAQELFGVTDVYLLNAMECHTTLKAKATKLDMIVFIADKLQWDQPGTPPFEKRIRDGLKISLERGALAYIEYLLEDPSRLKVLHPWLLAAYNALK